VGFKKAERKKSKLRLALSGPSGSGKTYGALAIAKGLGGRTAFIDTENGSASLYSDNFDFDVIELQPPYTPERFIELINEAEKEGYDNLIIDSITHEWGGSGGCLDINEKLAQASFKGNTWSAWSKTNERHRAFVDRIVQSPLHIISTMRSKTETSQIEQNGRKKVVKLGMKSEQRDGMEYEFTVVFDIVHDGNMATVSKDRTQMFLGDPFVISEETGKQLKGWLDTGKDVKDQQQEEKLKKTVQMLQRKLDSLESEEAINEYTESPEYLERAEKYTPDIQQAMQQAIDDRIEYVNNMNGHATQFNDSVGG